MKTQHRATEWPGSRKGSMKSLTQSVWLSLSIMLEGISSAAAADELTITSI
jgi:hypothetical protein